MMDSWFALKYQQANTAAHQEVRGNFSREVLKRAVQAPPICKRHVNVLQQLSALCLTTDEHLLYIDQSGASLD